MPDWGLAVGVAAVAGVASWGGTGCVLRALRARRILDEPNPRSSHSEPTPRGGGIAVVATLSFGLVVYAGLQGTFFEVVDAIVIVALMAVLATISWLDDLRSLSAGTRLGTQLVVVGIITGIVLHSQIRGDAGAPAYLQTAVLFLGWMWFLNLFNFMDGIDGIAGVETASIGIGFVAVAIIAPKLSFLIVPGMLLAAVALGFLVWNWYPAKIFLGDVGSVPLGFFIGYFLVRFAVNGYWLEALILPLYYWADATLTIARRLLQGHPPWRAHREHFYQRAVRAGMSHSRVALTVAGANAMLIGLAALSVSGWPVVAAALAVVVVASVLCYFGLMGARAPR